MGYSFIVNPCRDDILNLAVRRDEVLEIEAYGVSVQDALTSIVSGMERKQHVVNGLYFGDELLCVYGVFPSLVDNIGVPWMLSVEMGIHARIVSTFAPKILEDILFENYDHLENVVGSWNKKSISFLEHIGFTVDNKPISIGKNKETFHRFYIKR